ncbi:MAG: hypothetical protein MHPSP_002523, partial [Paramarteilia canceri]
YLEELELEKSMISAKVETEIMKTKVKPMQDEIQILHKQLDYCLNENAVYKHLSVESMHRSFSQLNLSDFGEKEKYQNENVTEDDRNFKEFIENKMNQLVEKNHSLLDKLDKVEKECEDIMKKYTKIKNQYNLSLKNHLVVFNVLLGIMEENDIYLDEDKQSYLQSLLNENCTIVFKK